MLPSILQVPILNLRNPPRDRNRASRITAESFLNRLADRGVEYVMANAGTDFAPIIEALSRNPGTNRKYPARHHRSRMRTSRCRWRTAITASAASRRW